MEYRFCFNLAKGFFALPCEVEKHLKEATADDLRVLLFVFRAGGGPLSEEAICTSLGISPDNVGRSLGYWASKGLFSIQSSESAKHAEAPAAASDPLPKKVVESRPQYSAEEISSKVNGNSELRFLLDSVPNLLGRLLSPSDCSVFIYLYDEAGLPADVILMLTEYCVSSGHGNIRYIEKTALSWAEDGIFTHEQAESRIVALEERRSYEGRIRAIMGISGRSLTSAERQHLNRWAQWDMPDDLIKLAYETCVNRTGKLSFSYINSILRAWHDKGYKTVEEAKAEKQQKAGRTPSYDINEYVDLSMKRLLNE